MLCLRRVGGSWIGWQFHQIKIAKGITVIILPYLKSIGYVLIFHYVFMLDLLMCCSVMVVAVCECLYVSPWDNKTSGYSNKEESSCDDVGSSNL